MAKGQVMAGEVRGKSVAEQSVEECGRVWQSVDECGRGQEQGKQGNDGQASRQGKGQRREIKRAATKNS